MACGDGGDAASEDAVDSAPVVTSEVPEIPTGPRIFKESANTAYEGEGWRDMWATISTWAKSSSPSSASSN